MQTGGLIEVDVDLLSADTVMTCPVCGNQRFILTADGRIFCVAAGGHDITLTMSELRKAAANNEIGTMPDCICGHPFGEHDTDDYCYGNDKEDCRCHEYREAQNPQPKGDGE